MFVRSIHIYEFTVTIIGLCIRSFFYQHRGHFLEEFYFICFGKLMLRSNFRKISYYSIKLKAMNIEKKNMIEKIKYSRTSRVVFIMNDKTVKTKKRSKSIDDKFTIS